MMTGLRFVLCFIILICTTSIGIGLGGRYSKRLKSLTAMEESLRLLYSEVTVFANPISIAIENISSKIKGDMKHTYMIIYQELKNNTSGDLYDSFLPAKEWLKHRCMLLEEDIDLFLSLGKVLGKTDRANQELQFTYVLEEISLLKEAAKEEKIKYEKMYRSLGILMGLGMIIILV